MIFPLAPPQFSLACLSRKGGWLDSTWFYQSLHKKVENGMDFYGITENGKTLVITKIRVQNE